MCVWWFYPPVASGVDHVAYAYTSNAPWDRCLQWAWFTHATTKNPPNHTHFKIQQATMLCIARIILEVAESGVWNGRGLYMPFQMHKSLLQTANHNTIYTIESSQQRDMNYELLISALCMHDSTFGQHKFPAIVFEGAATSTEPLSSYSGNESAKVILP
jgi:hypothetical protein